METHDTTMVIVVIVFTLIVFILLREILTWYWKVNKIVENQKSTNLLLEKQNKLIEENTAILIEFVDGLASSKPKE